jgi:hypothetical protein
MLGSVPSSLCLLTHVDHVSGPDDRDRRKTSSASGGYLEGIYLWLFSWSCSHYQERKKVTYLLLIWMVLEFCFCRIKAWCRGQAACEELRCWWLWCRGQKWFGWKVVSFAQDYHYACTRMLVFSCPCLGISLGILQALVTYLVTHFPVAWTQHSVITAVSTWGPFLATQS